MLPFVILLSYNAFNSITAKLLMILILAFLFIVVVVAVVIQTKAKPQVIAMTSEAVEESGSDIIDSIMSNINKINGLAHATSLLTGAMPKDEVVYQQTVGNLMTQMDPKIVGGGIWFDPNMYEWSTERQSFVWRRDATGKMVFTDKYDDETTVEDNYYQEWWYTPAVYAKHDDCVWSRAYIKAGTQSNTNTPMITCAKAVYGDMNQSFEGVVSFDIVLDNLNNMMMSWQEKIGGVDGKNGYLFLLDLDNRFLSFPDNALVMPTTERDEQGEVITVSQLAQRHQSYASIAQSVDNLNEQLIEKAKAENLERYEWVTGTIHRRTNMNKIDREEASLLSALLLLNEGASNSVTQSRLVDTVAVTNDAILKQDATAFVFITPFIHWKLVVVKPNTSLMGLANELSRELVLFMFLGFIPILVILTLLFNRLFAKPLKRMAEMLEQMSQLIQQNKYQELAN